jgi:hypothetical protein
MAWPWRGVTDENQGNVIQFDCPQFSDSKWDHPKTKALLPATKRQVSMKIIDLSGKKSAFFLHE